MMVNHIMKLHFLSQLSCIIGGFHSNYHTKTGEYFHYMGIKEGGKMVLFAGAGPMGLGAIDYALNCDRRPGLLVVTDINDERLERARKLFPEDEARKKGVELHFVNPKQYGRFHQGIDGIYGWNGI